MSGEEGGAPVDGVAAAPRQGGLPPELDVREQVKAMPIASTVSVDDLAGSFFPLLRQLGCSLAISTDESRLFLLGLRSGQATMRAVLVPKLCGLSVHGKFLAAAGFNGISIFKTTTGLAPVAPYAPNEYDAVYVPRAVHYTGHCEWHDMDFVEGVLTAVNTRYSCICTIDGQHSFTPVWKPPFITELRPQDRCHLNGMAIEGNRLRYVTMLGASNDPAGWRNSFAPAGGIVMDAEGRTVADNLSLPHSPRLIGNQLLCLESGRGQLLKIDTATGQKQILATLPGFTHGLSLYGGVLFIGLSKLRQRRTPVRLPLEERGDTLIAGIAALDAKTFETIGILQISAGAHEIFDLQVIPGVCSPDIRGPDQFAEHEAVDLPKECFWATPPQAAAGTPQSE